MSKGKPLFLCTNIVSCPVSGHDFSRAVLFDYSPGAPGSTFFWANLGFEKFTGEDKRRSRGEVLGVGVSPRSRDAENPSRGAAFFHSHTYRASYAIPARSSIAMNSSLKERTL
jgi:hypothetical protein